MRLRTDNPNYSGLSRAARLVWAVCTLVVSTSVFGQLGQPPMFWNTNPIAIADVSPAAPYPSQIPVSGFEGKVSTVIASLYGLNHTFSADVGVLLVGPAGQRVVLMNDVGNVGGSVIASNINLVFDQSAAVAIPQFSALTNGVFKPADYSFPGRRIFASPAPGGPYTNTLDAFNGSNPNGIWSLYVQDFAAGDSGVISNGWSLAIYPQLLIEGLQDMPAPGNTPLVQGFTVGGDLVGSPTYTFTAVSDNQSVVTNGGVAFMGSGTNWIVVVNPVRNASGSANITVTVVNQEAQGGSASFKVTFFCEYSGPAILPVPDQTISAGSMLEVPLTWGCGCCPHDSITVTAEASNTNLAPVGNIKLVGTNLLIWPAANLTGTTAIQVTARSAAGSRVETVFKVNVMPSPIPTFANKNPITVEDNQPATPYPSTINVSGLGGRISKLTVGIPGFTHGFPQDVSLLLIGPQGQSVVLMSRAGGSAPLINSWLSFDDSATNTLPHYTAIADGLYRPTDYSSSDRFFPPAPVAPYGRSLSVFSNTTPNGRWSLYVQDDQAGDSGLISGGWILHIDNNQLTTSQIGPQTTMENTGLSVAFVVGSATKPGSNIVVTVLSTNESPPGLIGNLTLAGSGAARALIISPAPNLPSAVTNVDGTCTIILTMMDGVSTNSVSFPLTVLYVNQPPTLCCLSNQTASVNRQLRLDFTVSDVDTPASNLVVSATVSDSSLGTVAVKGEAEARTLTFAPSGNVGQGVVCVLISDGESLVTNCFSLTLVADYPLPVISAIGDLTTNRTTTALNVATVFTVDGLGSAGATNAQIVASADNTNLVTRVSVFPNGGNAYVLLMTISPNFSGTSTITILARGEYGIASGMFKLTVLPSVQRLALGIGRTGDLLKIRASGGSPNLVCILESTTDLENWAGVTNVTADATGLAEFGVQLDGGPAAQFYRVRVGQ